MKYYECPRCGYNAKLKIDLKRHFSRKKLCPNIYSDLNIEECIELVFPAEKSASTLCQHSEPVASTLCQHRVNIASTFSGRASTLNVDARKSPEVTQKSDFHSNNINDLTETTYKCRKCDKVFKYRQSRHVHEKKCTETIKNKDELITELLEENNKLRRESENPNRQIIGNNSNNTKKKNTNEKTT